MQILFCCFFNISNSDRAVELSDLVLKTQCTQFFLFFSYLLVCVCSIFICDQLRYPPHWMSPVLRPVRIIRFGNAENKLMLFSMHMHTLTHTYIHFSARTYTVCSRLCKVVSHASFEMYRMRLEEGFSKDKQSSVGGHGELVKFNMNQRHRRKLLSIKVSIFLTL